MKKFRNARKTVGDLGADTVAQLMCAAADVALVLDRKGVIRDVAFGSDELAAELAGDWIGESWGHTVKPDSRAKIESLLRDAAEGGSPRGRQVNHATPGGGKVAVVYRALPLGDTGRFVALGRDLRSLADLQQRLIEAEVSLERDFARLRHAELRYRLLFQIAAEPILVLDAAAQRIVDANPAALELLGRGQSRIAGKLLSDVVEQETARALVAQVSTVRAAGHCDDTRLRLGERRREFTVSATMFRQDDTVMFLVRMSPIGAGAAVATADPVRSRLIELIESLPDGFILTDRDGHVLTANRAFLDMVESSTEQQVLGESLERWLGRAGVDLGVLVASLRQNGTVRAFATSLRGAFGASVEVEIAAAAAPNGGEAAFGFVIRDVSRRQAAAAAAQRGKVLPRSVEQLTELVGRVSLKELVREATDVIERLCIEAALDLTGDNRASAAEMLGLSRQSLYVKLRRYGLGDLGEPQGSDSR